MKRKSFFTTPPSTQCIRSIAIPKVKSGISLDNAQTPLTPMTNVSGLAVEASSSHCTCVLKVKSFVYGYICVFSGSLPSEKHDGQQNLPLNCMKFRYSHFAGKSHVPDKRTPLIFILSLLDSLMFIPR